MINKPLPTTKEVTLKQIKDLLPETSIRVRSAAGNMFDIWKDFTVKSVQNGTIYKADTLTEAKFFIRCYK